MVEARQKFYGDTVTASSRYFEFRVPDGLDRFEVKEVRLIPNREAEVQQSTLKIYSKSDRVYIAGDRREELPLYALCSAAPAFKGSSAVVGHVSKVAPYVLPAGSGMVFEARDISGGASIQISVNGKLIGDFG